MTSASPSRCRGDHGAALVEAAVIGPVFFVLIFGILEFGLAFRSYLAVGNATTWSSRAASTFGSDWEADANIIAAVKQGSSAFGQSDIQRVVVWKATGPDDSVPAPCLGATGVAGLCNVYTPDPHFTYDQSTQFNDDLEADCDLDKPAEFWCPMTRNTAVTDPPDYVGIYIEVQHNFVTGLFGDSLTMDDTKVIRLEPTSLN